ncbi:MAG: hypothetical protein WBI20_06710 [Burkholderiaceae bacterium]
MIKPLLIPIFIFHLLSTPLLAQTVYRCGDSYSQTPCPGGQQIDPRDGRQATQKAQADASTARQGQAARNLEQERHKQEAAAAKANSKSAAQVAPAPIDKKLTPSKKPEYFTAREPVQKKTTDKNSSVKP